jgi:3-hydroxyacyl-[acyl-carrier-protein] dehydratase
MRWYWIDRFIEFESGCYAKAVKNVPLTEEYLRDHFPGCPLMPKSLITEGMAQTGGLLVSEYGDFTEQVVLAKIPKARFFAEVTPGSQLVYTTTIEYIKKDGAVVSATSHVDGRIQAEMEIVFAHLNGEQGGSFEPKIFLQMMRVLGAFEAGAREPRQEPRSVPLRPVAAELSAGRQAAASA